MSTPVEVVLIIAAIGYLMVRRLTGEPAQAKRMLILPAVLSVIGLNDLSGHVKTPLSLGFLTATAAVAVLLGAARGASVRISQRDGLAFVRYTGFTVLLWGVNLAVKLGANLALHIAAPHDADVAGNSLLFTLGLGILAEGLVILYRALRSDHRVMWAEGQNGARHQMSPVLNDLQRNLTHRTTTPYDHRDAAGWDPRTDRPGSHHPH